MSLQDSAASCTLLPKMAEFEESVRVSDWLNCWRATWPWVLPPTAPTDPYVRTLAHTVLLMRDSPCSELLQARIAILGRYGDT